MKKVFKALVLCLVILLTVALPASAASDLSYDSYIYNAYGESVPAPDGYEPIAKINGEMLGCGALNGAQDIFYSESDGLLYIADTGNNRVVVLSKDYEFVSVLDTVVIDGVKEPLTDPNGIFVSNGELYIAQTSVHRVIKCDTSGNVTAVYERPETDMLDENVVFSPTKVIVNNSGTVYVIIENFVYGALTYDPNGDFITFYGSNTVDVTFELLMNYFWKQIMSQSQVNSMKRYVPVAYTNFCIDDDNFVYTVTKTADSEQVRKLNTLGNNVLPEYTRNISSQTGDYGDLEVGVLNSQVSTNNFIDVAVDSDGFINLLDQSNGRIFQYDQESRLLHIFGGNGDGGYGFKTVSAIENCGNDIVVLDSDDKSITVFRSTEYGDLVRSAVLLYNDGHYEEAIDQWNEILLRNQNLEIAYDGLGKAAFENGEYRQAMKYYKSAYNREGYSRALQEYRSSLIRTVLPTLITVIVVLLVLWKFVIKRFIPQRTHRNHPALQFITNPSDEASERKFHNSFGLKTVFFSLALLFISMVFQRQLTAFTFNYNNLEEGNVLITLLVVVFLFFAFCIVNWCFTSLLDGKGKLSEIMCCCAYSVIPYCVSLLISVALSHFFIIDEGAFLTVITVIGAVWSLFVLVMSLKSIHEYSISKTILSILLSVLGVVFLIFLIALMAALLQQVFNFFVTIYNELMYR